METIDETTVRIARDEPVDTEQLGVELPAAIVLELINPKELAGGKTAELTFEESTGAHIELIGKAGTERAQAEVAARVIAECCGISTDEYKRLGTRDIARLSEILAYFLGSGSAASTTQ
jgi:hypothetical protein